MFAAHGDGVVRSALGVSLPWDGVGGVLYPGVQPGGVLQEEGEGELKRG